MKLNDFINENFSKTEFFIQILLSHYKTPLKAAKIEELCDYKRVTVNSSLSRLVNSKKIIKDDYHGVSTYIIIDPIELTGQQYDILAKANEQIVSISPNGWRAIVISMINNGYYINDLVKLGWPEISAYKISKALLDANILKLDENDKYILNIKSSQSSLNEYLSYQFKNSLMFNNYNNNDPISNIMHYYCDKSNQLEVESNQRVETKLVYNLFSWDKYDYFDLTYSFWTMFSLGIYYSNPSSPYYITEESKNVHGVYKNSTFYESYPQKIINQDPITLNEYSNLISKFPNIIEYSNLCYSPASIIPVLKHFNQVKGIGKCISTDGKEYTAHDFLSLFCDLIEYALANNLELQYYNSYIKSTELQEWKEFLVNNINNLALQEEYEIIDGKLAGKPLFTGASLENPIPLTKMQYQEMLCNSINRLKNRANLLASSVTKGEQ